MVVLGPGTQEEKEQILAEAKAGLKKEQRAEKLARLQATGQRFGKMSTPVTRTISKAYAKPRKGQGVGKVALGVTGMLGIPGGQSVSMGKKGSGRGRGRPAKSYKYSIPGIGPVPIQAYKRYMSQLKAQARLQRELKMARLSAQAPPDHVRGGGGADDAWLMSEDMSQPQQGMPEFEPQMAPAGGKGFGGFRMPGFGRGAPMQQFDEFGNPIQGQPILGRKPPMSAGIGGSGRLNIWGRPMKEGKNILNAKNVFNNPGETQVRP